MGKQAKTPRKGRRCDVLGGVDDYRTGLLLMFAAAALGMLATLLVRETGCRNIWRARESG